VAARFATFLVLVASAIGLLSTPIGDYDDSLMLMGARLTAAGRIPYVDFYSHYGPLGFTLLSTLTRLFGSPGLALRMGEIILLTAIAIATHVLYRSVQTGSRFGEYAVPLLVLAFSQIAMQPAFFGFVFATAALVFFLLARTASRIIPAVLLSVAAGAALASAALVRPAFAGYSAAALLLLEVAAGRPRFGVLQSPASAFVPFFGAAALAALAAWALLYSKIPPSVAFDATILAPARLMGAGGARYLHPRFLDFAGNLGFGVAWGVAAGAALTAITVAWALTLATPGKPRLGLACVGAGGLLPLLLTISEHPGRDAGLLALALLGLAAAVAFGFRVALTESPLLRASASFGLAAAAFGHYFWARADSTHLLPLLTLALAGAGLLLTRLRVSGRLALLGLIFLADVSGAASRSALAGLSSLDPSVLSPFYFPAAKLFKRNIREHPQPWRCTRFPADVRDAVAFADRHADPRSRFVAVGSSQAWSSGNPVALFLISSRLPYTRWYHYDPGLQSSPEVQREMERELESSGSESAVVWKAHRYVFDRNRPNPRDRSAFDDFFDRLYPITGAQFGDYDVRLRSPAASRPPGAGAAH